MATRPDCDLRTALTVVRTVETGQTVAVGRVVKDGNADKECQHTTDGVDAIGVVVALGNLAGAAGDKVSICLLAGSAVVPVKVGTGGATRGKKAKCVADGVTDAVISEATPTMAHTVGFFTQSGVAGDIVGMVPLAGYATE
jgi:hypothetical protein